jgi:8-oxo-dGTP pyrophosphatase MutT (NUDIX family)
MAEHHPKTIQDLANRFAEHGVSFGRMADAKMPFTRPTKSEALAQGFHVRLAAVLLTLVPSQGQWCLVLMKRPEYPGVHSGQISIPGGEVEAEDTDDLSTALREFEEEMGVVVSRDDVIADLTERYIPPSNFAVKPFIAVLDRMPMWKVDSKEVAEVVVVPVADLLPDDALRNTAIKMGKDQNQEIHLPAYRFEEHIIWGATAIMLAEFVAAWKKTFPNPVATALDVC